jgi:choline kinase
VGVHDAKSSQILMREISDGAVPDGLTDFSDVSNPEVIAKIALRSIPGWTDFRREDIVISQICEGLSNQLFKLSLSQKTRQRIGGGYITTALFRIYGREISTLIDADSEFEIFRCLGRYRIAPQMLAHGNGWRIEEWHHAVALPTRLMRNPSISCQVASQLGRLHKLHRRHDFPRDFSREPLTQVRLTRWAEAAATAAQRVLEGAESEHRRKLQDLQVADMVEEAKWLSRWVLRDDLRVSGSGLDVVFSHNDLQENNVLQTQYGLRLIDFEYSGFNYQAADVGNYFCEFTLNYIEKEYPFYTTDLNAYPSVDLQKMFVSVYLSEYLETCILPTDDSFITPFLERVHRFTLVSHLLWALWSVVRAGQAHTFGEFDFLHFSQFRFDAYRRLKYQIAPTSSRTLTVRGRNSSSREKSSLMRQ